MEIVGYAGSILLVLIVFMRRANSLILVQVVIHGSVLSLQASPMCYLAVHHSTSRVFGFLFQSTSVPLTISLLYGFNSFLTIPKI